MSTLASISNSLAATGLSVGIQDRFWVVPTVQAVHILAICVVLSSVAFLDLRLAGLIGREQSLQGMTRRYYRWIWTALCVLLASGLLLVIAEPARELLNWIFWAKMSLIIGAILLTAPLRSKVEDARFGDHAPGKRKLLRTCALASLALWMAVIVCGRWIAYAGGDYFA